MAAVDFARLRNQTMADGQDSEVTVNTRALIDKVLARYSSEHTTLRELIQNASDAGATDVVIRLETDPSLDTPTPQDSDRAVMLKHIIQHHTLKRLIVSNNGAPFTAADWSRLKSIAEGNPDETKIGAFGVGFYSVFADCDEPFVVSGDKTMAFYWKGNTLSTKVATIPIQHASADTTFSLEYRQANPASPSYNPSKLPNLPSLCQFLATSLTFVGLQSIKLYIDNYRVTSFTKKTSPPSDIQVPSGLKTDTEGGLMRVSQVARQHSQIEAEWHNVIATAQDPPKRAVDLVPAEVRNAGTTLKSFFSKFSGAAPRPPATVTKSAPGPGTTNGTLTPKEDMSGESKGVVFLQVVSVEVSTRVSRNFAAEIERATKKPPPKRTKIALLTCPYSDPSASLSTGTGATAQLSSKIFSDILPVNSGRIFIGFPTAQTTGFLVHISAPSLIPTVERENVDMNARYISTWNMELLRVAGLGCRISYSMDMAEVRNGLDKHSTQDLIPRAVYTFKQYTSYASHPSTKLGDTVEEAFWGCSKEASIGILSTKGVLPSKSVRMPAETLSFLNEVPMVPQELATEAVSFMMKLHNRGFISDLTMADIQRGLESRALNEEELVEFIKWCGAKIESKEIDKDGIQGLFDVTVANIDIRADQSSGKILALGDINNYVNAQRIAPTLPVPSDTMPFAFSKAVPVKQLQMFGWTELSMVRWLRFMTATPQLKAFTTDENMALQILGLTSKMWDQLDVGSKEAVVNILTPHSVMPTKMGMRRPEEAYFPTVKIFEDLPTVKSFPGSKDKFLLALGVRKTVDLPMVFDRMRKRDATQQSEKAPWNHVDLLRYFASVIDEMPKKDLERLRATAFLPGEGVGVQHGQLFKAQELYAPDQAFLSLGLIQVKLPFEYRSTSKEGALLLRLGLKQWPNAMIIMGILHRAGLAKDQQLYTLALEYFLLNHYKNGYAAETKDVAAVNYPILPTEQNPFPNLVAPSQCFTNEAACCLGYVALSTSLRPHADKFGVRQNPDLKECVQRLLRQPPKRKADAETQFNYFASRATELDQHRSLISEISAAKFVPIFRKYYVEGKSIGFEDRSKDQAGKTEYRIHHYEAPEAVFVGHDQEYRGILDYVQYGGEATAFLLKVGAKHEPSSHDLAGLLAKNPAGFLNTIGEDRYQDLLRKLAEHADTLWKDKDLVRRLISAPVLLGYRDIRKDPKKLISIDEENLDDLEEPDMQREFSLHKANEIVIIDDVHFLTMFRDFIISAPQEEVLEAFYTRFGVKKVSELVKTEQRIGQTLRDQSAANKLRKDILERARLFLHEYERDSSSKSIRHDAKWLSNNLSVNCVSEISTRYSLTDRNAATSSTKTAVIIRTRAAGTVLHITPKYDMYEVSRALVPHLIQRPKQNDVIALERILTESLRRLKEKGINVERILRKKEYEARIAEQQELEQEHQEHQRAAKETKESEAGSMTRAEPILPHVPATPDRSTNMPGAFGSPENMEVAENTNRPSSNKGVLNDWAKRLGFKNNSHAGTRATPGSTDGPQITRDLQSTKSNIANAVKDCRPTNMQAINSRHHQDPTELDKGGYCNGEQWENLHKAFSIPYSGRDVDIYYGKDQPESPAALQPSLNAFLPLLFGLTSVIGVNPAAVNVFLDDKSNTVAFNLGGSLFFNLSWFRGLHESGWGSVEGRLRALDSWFFTYCHELAHNLVGDHDARHSWYQQQIAIEFSQQYRAALGNFLKGL